MIQVENLFRTYGVDDASVHAPAGVSLTIERGDFVAIMGSSGSGKSTLMNMIGCLDVPSSGSYRLDGVDVGSLSEAKLSDIRNQKIGFVFQSFNLLRRTSASRNVELPLIYAGVGPLERRRRAHAALASVGLADRTGHHPAQLSGEPTGALDSRSTADMLAIFDGLNTEGRTLVVITHEDEVARHAKRVVTLVDGTITSDARQGPVAGPPPLWFPSIPSILSSTPSQGGSQSSATVWPGGCSRARVRWAGASCSTARPTRSSACCASAVPRCSSAGSAR